MLQTSKTKGRSSVKSRSRPHRSTRGEVEFPLVRSTTPAPTADRPTPISTCEAFNGGHPPFDEPTAHRTQGEAVVPVFAPSAHNVPMEPMVTSDSHTLSPNDVGIAAALARISRTLRC